MIRVGFVLGEVNDGWLGGLNYFRNLFSALDLIEDRKLQVVVFVSSDAAESFVRKFKNIEMVRSQIFDSKSAGGILWRVLKKISGKGDILLYQLLAHHQIAVLSHFGPLRRGSKIKTIGWIPDFQHIHLPEFFSQREIDQRNKAYMKLARGCDRVLLSSESARQDLSSFFKEAAVKSRVLRFVPEINPGYLQVTLVELKRKYNFHAPYFHLPNQFWAHKNHKIVIEALAELKHKKGGAPIVLATGKEHDYRHPGHFQNLMAQVENLGLRDRFKSLGVVPYEDMLALMRHSVAVINPSFFEGWSSTVEEAKALGKTLLLSDLPVHREQNPEHGIFFGPKDVDGLAAAIQASLDAAAIRQVDNEDDARTMYLRNRTGYAQQYQDIVVEVVASAK